MPNLEKLKMSTIKELVIIGGKVKYIYNEPEMVSEEVFDYIAENFEQNVRELEGAFNKVCAFAEITEQALDLKLAKEVLKINVLFYIGGFLMFFRIACHSIAEWSVCDFDG